jgi:cystathionine beta-lyase/cystathionine gamma-synthase
MKLATKFIHAGQDPDPRTGAVNVPINTSSTYKQDGVGVQRDGYEYARSGNPSRRSLEQTLAAAENGKFGRAFASGLAAETAVLSLLSPGDEVVSTPDIYGGTYRLFTKVFPKYGISFRFVESHDPAEIAKAFTAKTRLIWIETPTNPLLNIVDIAEVAARKPKDAILAVDNTFASPYFQTPLDLGADLTVHSTTKYIGGHSDIIGGAIVTNRADLDEPLGFYQNAAGSIQSPYESYLVQRGLKTLAVRMEQHQSNARVVAEFLRGHTAVEKVFFAGFEDHPGYAVAKKQMRGQPGMVSLRLQGGRPSVDRFIRGLSLITFAESLGGVESLACYPYLMTHGSIPAEQKDRIGITENLVRLSIGIEDPEDLLDDLRRALG